MEKMEIDINGLVVYFLFGSLENEIYYDEGQPGLMTGRDEKTDEIIGYMTYNLFHLYDRIMAGLQEKPIPGEFVITSLDHPLY